MDKIPPKHHLDTVNNMHICSDRCRTDGNRPVGRGRPTTTATAVSTDRTHRREGLLTRAEEVQECVTGVRSGGAVNSGLAGRNHRLLPRYRSHTRHSDAWHEVRKISSRVVLGKNSVENTLKTHYTLSKQFQWGQDRGSRGSGERQDPVGPKGEQVLRGRVSRDDCHPEAG